MSDSEPDIATSDLRPSKLGTKEYWDSVYKKEVLNLNDFGDEGEVWFGEESVKKIVDWALANVPQSSDPASTSKENVSILEIGSGNGNLLFALAEAGYDARRLKGIDYSCDAVQLAQGVAIERQRRCADVRLVDVVFEEVDFLGLEEGEVRARLKVVAGKEAQVEEGEGDGWTLVLDKGTYDAMALAERDEQGRRPCDAYPRKVAALLDPGGYFLITSCNFTREELLRTFETPETGLKYHSEIKFKSISFGGMQGSTYCSVAFQKGSEKQ